MKKETMLKTMMDSIFNVLESMFFLIVQTADNDCPLQEWFTHNPSVIGATLGFKGSFEGSFYLLMPLEIAYEITGNFLGLDPEEIDEDQMKDTVKEALNMIGGGFLSLFDTEGIFKLGIPELVGNGDLSLDNILALKNDIIRLETENNRLAAGITVN